MKNTKVFLIFTLVLIITFIIINTLSWWISESMTWKACMTHGFTIVTMILLGWIPAVIVACDYEEHLKNK
jgi:hypothetical protein